MSDDEPHGWWAKIVKVDEQTRKVWIGPMTRSSMKEHDDTYRHNFSATDPNSSECTCQHEGGWSEWETPTMRGMLCHACGRNFSVVTKRAALQERAE
jgi:hypothetical protein